MKHSMMHCACTHISNRLLLKYAQLANDRFYEVRSPNKILCNKN